MSNKNLLKVRLQQMDIHPADPAANADAVSEFICRASADGIDMLCVPEMFLTGFQWQRNESLAACSSRALTRIEEVCRQENIAFSGSFYSMNAAGKASNTACLILPSARQQVRYDKIHLFELMDEPAHLRAGDQVVTCATPWGHFGLAICYDLRFPELFHALALAGTDLFLLPSAWPAKRLNHWRILLQARAIENQSFVVAVNQAGVEGQWGASGEQAYAGHSMVVDPFGVILGELAKEPGQLDVKLDMNSVARARKAIHTLHNRRPEVYGIG